MYLCLFSLEREKETGGGGKLKRSERLVELGTKNVIRSRFYHMFWFKTKEDIFISLNWRHFVSLYKKKTRKEKMQKFSKLAETPDMDRNDEIAEWLNSKQLLDCYHILKAEGAKSLKHLSNLTTEDVTRICFKYRAQIMIVTRRNLISEIDELNQQCKHTAQKWKWKDSLKELERIRQSKQKNSECSDQEDMDWKADEPSVDAASAAVASTAAAKCVSLEEQKKQERGLLVLGGVSEIHGRSNPSCSSRWSKGSIALSSAIFLSSMEGQWEDTEPLPWSVFGSCAVHWSQRTMLEAERSMVFVFGGQYRLPESTMIGDRYTKEVLAYDVHNRKWSPAGTYPPLPQKKSYAAAAVLDGKIHVVGGLVETENRPLDVQYHPSFSHLQFDPRTKEWTTTLESLPSPARYGIGLAVSDSGKMYAVGGRSKTTFDLFSLDRVDRYDPQNDQWTRVASMHWRRYYPAVTCFRGHIYAIGGYSVPDQSSVERYVEEEDRWEMVAPLNQPRYGAVAVVFQGRLLVIGGYCEGIGRLTSVEYYIKEENRWVYGPPLPQCRDELMAVVSY